MFSHTAKQTAQYSKKSELAVRATQSIITIILAIIIIR